MKRKNWAPGGGNKGLRGKDEWVRISWDEALDIVASEIKRIKDNTMTSLSFAPAEATCLACMGARCRFGGQIRAAPGVQPGVWSSDSEWLRRMQ